MLVLDVLQDVMLSELAQTARYESGDLNSLSVVDVNRLVSQLNRGLAEIFKRFMLKRVDLPLGQGKENREVALPSEVIEVLRVYDTQGAEYPLNRSDRALSVRLVKPTTLYFPKGFHSSVPLFAEVHMGHRKIPSIVTNVNELDGIEIDLPDAYREALVMFIMSRMTAPIGAMAIGQRMYNESLAYYQQFEAICVSLVAQGLDVQQYEDTTQFCNKGFV